jgi:hypothetical protein
MDLKVKILRGGYTIIYSEFYVTLAHVIYLSSQVV